MKELLYDLEKGKSFQVGGRNKEGVSLSL